MVAWHRFGVGVHHPGMQAHLISSFYYEGLPEIVLIDPVPSFASIAAWYGAEMQNAWLEKGGLAAELKFIWSRIPILSASSCVLTTYQPSIGNVYCFLHCGLFLWILLLWV